MSPVIVITGAGRGIGAATARLAAARGFDVCINYLKNQMAAETVADAVRAEGRRAITVAGDMGREADIMRLFETADAELGRLTALVNNAADMGGFCRVEEVRADTLERVFAVNVAGPFLCCREALRRMSTKHGGAGGAIVNISSTAAGRGSPGDWVHYAASKGAVNTFTKGLALEVAGEGVRVNAVAPGLTDTENHAMYGQPDRVEKWKPKLPMGRAARPEEIAAAVVWLLSDDASYITGTVQTVAGGA